MLKTKEVKFSYSKENQMRFPDLNVKKGESLLVLGESGSGKTTLIQIIAGLLKPNSGLVEFNGTNYEKLTQKKLDQFRGRHIGMVFQKPHFVRNISIIENIMLSLYLSKNKHDEKQIKELLEQVGLKNKANFLPDQLSQGEQQRSAIALAVAKRPDMILADEPTSSLDDSNCYKTIRLLKNQAQSKNAQLIIITHDQRLKDQFKNSISL
tara:strand:- start:17 stop:643 length:627 start_codon:yes stop_codon:yes gene_type:complete